MFGDSMFEEEERSRRDEEHREWENGATDDQFEDLMAAGGLDERLRRRQAVAQLLREVGGC